MAIYHVRKEKSYYITSKKLTMMVQCGHLKCNQEVELLLDQRKELINSIDKMYSNMFKVIIAVIPLIGTIAVADSSVATGEGSFFSPFVKFVMLELLLLFSMAISVFLFNTNVNRDYIIAIDTYLSKKYGITALLHNGELSRKHTTGISGVFPQTTILLGFGAIIFAAILALRVVMTDCSFYKNNLYLLLFFIYPNIISFCYFYNEFFTQRIRQAYKSYKRCLEVS